MSKSEERDDNGGPAAPEGKIPKDPSVFSPGSTIGILGSGQLGRMSAMAAKSLGYQVAVYDVSPEGPACSCADHSIVAPFDDLDALARFASVADVVTVEFENIPVSVMEFLEERVVVRPSASVIRICQDRILEKKFLQSHGFPVAPFRIISSATDLAAGLSSLNAPSILKTASLGYDGKGQLRLSPGDETKTAWARLAGQGGIPRAVLEQRIDFLSEASVICARTPSGETRCFPVQENIHSSGILDVTIAPASLDPAVGAKAQEIAASIAEHLGVIGLITVEYFVLPGGSLMVNELAPRPHNSGHHTLETTITSQFAQHIRAVCGLPLGAVDFRSHGAMLNLLGDLWAGGEPDWQLLLREPNSTEHRDEILHELEHRRVDAPNGRGDRKPVGERREPDVCEHAQERR